MSRTVVALAQMRLVSSVGRAVDPRIPRRHHHPIAPRARHQRDQDQRRDDEPCAPCVPSSPRRAPTLPRTAAAAPVLRDRQDRLAAVEMPPAIVLHHAHRTRPTTRPTPMSALAPARSLAGSSSSRGALKLSNRRKRGKTVARKRARTAASAASKPTYEQIERCLREE